MIDFPKELDGLVEYKDGKLILKDGATKRQCEQFREFQKLFSCPFEVIKKEDGSVTITNY